MTGSPAMPRSGMTPWPRAWDPVAACGGLARALQSIPHHPPGHPTRQDRPPSACLSAGREGVEGTKAYDVLSIVPAKQLLSKSDATPP